MSREEMRDIQDEGFELFARDEIRYSRHGEPIGRSIYSRPAGWEQCVGCGDLSACCPQCRCCYPCCSCSEADSKA